MESKSVNQQFKEYEANGGTMKFKEFLDKHNRKKNAIGDTEINSMFINATGAMDSMFGKVPIEENKEVTVVGQFKNDTGGVSSGANTDNMTFGINNYVIIGTAVIIIGAIGFNYYMKHKK
jgi:hypothetical protein